MPGLVRRVVAAPLITLLAASGVLAATAAPAVADDATTLTVVGTSDVFDSNLIQAVIKPDFEALNPGITLNYVSLGTGAAITYAKSGAASALLVHAASLENQFVGAGYSLEQYGRAIFYGDYVLLGPANDPAKVLSGGQPSHDIVSAFQKIAAAGAQGKANFVSRGGTPGTTVQEHAIWALTKNVPVCTVSATNGGGKSPSTTSGDCSVPIAYPSWYHATGLTQGPNIVNGDTCDYSGGGCYVFTDRGTFQYLKSTNSIANLQIVTRDNSAQAPGGTTVLVNSFHAYGVNPAPFAGDPNVSINVDQARNFLAFITSPPEQAKIGNYLAGNGDKAAFIPDAAPLITVPTAPPAAVDSGKPVTIAGKVKNQDPGTPKLSNVPVTLTFTPTADASVHVVKHGTTDSTGSYSFSYVPTAQGTYSVSTGQITKIEDGTLSPKFGDILVPGTSDSVGAIGVNAAPVTINGLSPHKKSLAGTATVSPVPVYQAGRLELWGAPGTDTNATLQLQGFVPVPIGGPKQVSFSYPLTAGPWVIQLHYVNDGVINQSVSPVKSVKIG